MSDVLCKSDESFPADEGTYNIAPAATAASTHGKVYQYGSGMRSLQKTYFTYILRVA